MPKDIKPRIVESSSCNTLHAFGDEVLIHLSGADTGGKFCMFTITSPPGGGPPPHYHENEDEWFFLMAGDIEFLIDGKWVRGNEGATVFMPRGSIHTFRNIGKSPSKLLTHTSPSGFEKFFEECASVFANPNGPDMSLIIEISGKYGIQFVESQGTTQ